MKRVLILAALLTLAPASAVAEKTKGGHIVCLTRDLLDEFGQAAVKKDSRAIDYLSKNGCFVLKAGVPLSVLERDWGKAKVRLYVGDDSVVAWTVVENIVD